MNDVIEGKMELSEITPVNEMTYREMMAMKYPKQVSLKKWYRQREQAFLSKKRVDSEPAPVQ
jgi:hypothetical protein